MQRRQRERGFVSLNELRSRIDSGYYYNNNNNRKWLSVIGFIVEFSLPRHCNGPDYVVTLKLIDDSSQQQLELGCSVFGSSVDLLPLPPLSNLDIIILNNVKVQPHQQQRLSVCFDKNSSSFAVYNSSFTPYQSSPTFRPLPSDTLYIRRLMDSNPTFDSGISNYVVSSLHHIKDGFFDLVCKVLDVRLVSNHWLIYVWDGADAPPLPIDDGGQNPLPLQLEQEPLPSNLLCKFPSLGSVLRIFADETYVNLGAHFHTVGNWVRIRNLQCKRHLSGFWRGTLAQNTKIRLLSDNDESVKQRVSKFEERINKCNHEPSSWRCVSRCLTVTNQADEGFVTLMDLLKFTSEGLRKSECIVRVVAVYPSQVEEILLSHGMIRIKMILEDPTARIQALLCGKHAADFFGSDRTDVMTSKINKLLGVTGCGGAPRDPPWIKCCIEMHCGESDIANKTFLLSDTRLV